MGLLGPRGEREGRREKRRELGLGPCGKEGKARDGKGREGERDGPGEELAQGLLLLSFFSLSFSIPKHSNNYLNSNAN
jgi:hypothetical protein